MDAGVCLHPDRLDVVLLGSLEVGVIEQVGRDADLLGRAVDEFGHGAVPEQMRPDGLAKCLPRKPEVIRYPAVR